MLYPMYNKQSLISSMGLCLFIIAAVSVLLVSGAPTKPHIVFVLVDDWGHADVSFRNPAIYTPNFKKLADSGVILNRHYVFKYCSPRVAFLTGRLKAHWASYMPPVARLAPAHS